jgi:hypothetical protein
VPLYVQFEKTVLLAATADAAYLSVHMLNPIAIALATP